MSTPQQRARDEADIVAIEAAYDEAWNRGDAPALVAAMAEDAVVVNPRGSVAVGKAEFASVMTEMLAGPFSGTKHESRVLRIRFPASDVAVVDGEATVSGTNESDAPSVVRFTDIFARRDGRWLLTDVRAYVFLPQQP